MSRERHPTPSVFAAGRDQRQLYARDTRLSETAPLRFMREGEAERLRVECGDGILICPVPDCADPRYTTVGGSKRDHFRHLSLAGGVHAPETYHHFTGKRVVGGWASRVHPEATVHVDSRAVRTDAGSVQVPDVLVEFPDGRRFAFEIQYAGLSVDDWRRRHAGYQEQGIFDVWLWGHERRYLRQSRSHGDRIELAPAVFAAQRAGVPLHWINPDEALIASRRDVSDPWTEAERRQGRRGRPQWETLSLAFERLDNCRIEGNRFITPLQRFEVEHRVEIARDLLARRDLDRRERAALIKAREESDRQREARRAYAQQKTDEDFDRRLRPTVERRFAGALDVIDVALQFDRSVYRTPAHWHAKLFDLFIEGKIGQMFTFREVMERLMDRLHGRIDHMPAAAYWYLLFLHKRGWLSCALDDRGLITECKVLADSAHRPGTDGTLPAGPDLPRFEMAERH